jgi:hypothetical protein
LTGEDTMAFIQLPPQQEADDQAAELFAANAEPAS